MGHVPPGKIRLKGKVYEVSNDIPAFNNPGNIKIFLKKHKSEPIPQPNDLDSFIGAMLMKNNALSAEIFYYFRDFNGERVAGTFQKPIKYNLIVTHISIPKKFKQVKIDITFKTIGGKVEIDRFDSSKKNIIYGPLENAAWNYNGYFAVCKLAVGQSKTFNGSVFEDPNKINHAITVDPQGADYGCGIFIISCLGSTKDEEKKIPNLNQMVFFYAWKFYIPIIHDTGQIIFLRISGQKKIRTKILRHIFTEVYIKNAMKIGFYNPVEYDEKLGIYYVEVKDSPNPRDRGMVSFSLKEFKKLIK